MQVEVTGYGARAIDRALLVLKRKLAKEGVFKEVRRQTYYEKPSERRKRKRAEAQRRRTRAQRHWERQQAAQAAEAQS